MEIKNFTSFTVVYTDSEGVQITLPPHSDPCKLVEKNASQDKSRLIQSVSVSSFFSPDFPSDIATMVHCIVDKNFYYRHLSYMPQLIVPYEYTYNKDNNTITVKSFR